MKYLIVNADDFGLSEAVNEGIIEAHLHGIVTCASLLTNVPAFSHACELAHKHPQLEIGFHANLTSGRPVLPGELVPSLVDRNGRFFGLWTFACRCLAGLASYRDIEKELTAQMQKAWGQKIFFTHIDGHHHIECLPVVAAVLVEMAKKKKIPFIRRIASPKRIGPWLPFFQQWALSLLQRRAPSGESASTDHFWGLELYRSKDKTAMLERLLCRLPDGINELMCHPGYDRSDVVATNYRTERENELRALLHPRTKKLIETFGIQLASFSDIGLLT